LPHLAELAPIIVRLVEKSRRWNLARSAIVPNDQASCALQYD